MSPLKILRSIRQKSPAELFSYAWIIARNAAGLENRLDTPDRRLLEDVVLPFYASLPEVERVLFVGTDWFTRHYDSLFPGKEFWTIDPSPWKRQFGTPRHVADTLQNLGAHFSPGYFQLIVCNGVFGWGLNGREDCEQAFLQCFERLSPGGHLLFGWNDLPAYRPFPPSEIASLRRFRPFVLPPLAAEHCIAGPDNRHLFEFYFKPSAAELP